MFRQYTNESISEIVKKLHIDFYDPKVSIQSILFLMYKKITNKHPLNGP